MGKTYSYYHVPDLVHILTAAGSTNVERLLAVEYLMKFQQDDGYDFFLSAENLAQIGEFGIGHRVPGSAAFIQPFALHILGRTIAMSRGDQTHWAVKFLDMAEKTYTSWHPVHQVAKHWLSIIRHGGV